jgi:hypothetical protein
MASAVLKIVVPVVGSFILGLIPTVINMIRERRQRAPRPPDAMAVERMIERAQHDLGMELVGFLNFAFCGPQNSGK